jgi:hypothetical protein
MQAPQVRTLDAGRRVQVFLDAHAATIGKAVPPSLRTMLDDSVTQLAGFQVEQGTAENTAKGETVNQAALRDTLYQDFMVQIGRTAKVALKSTPEYPSLVVPAIARRKIDFVATATKFAAAAALHDQLLIQHGMPTDFVAQLQAAITTVSASADAQARAISRRIAATTGCVAMNKAVRDKIGQIDGLLKPALKGNAALLSDWAASKRVRQPAVNPLPTGSTVPAPASGTPTSTPSAPVPPVTPGVVSPVASA